MPAGEMMQIFIYPAGTEIPSDNRRRRAPCPKPSQPNQFRLRRWATPRPQLGAASFIGEGPQLGCSGRPHGVHEAVHRLGQLCVHFVRDRHDVG